MIKNMIIKKNYIQDNNYSNCMINSFYANIINYLLLFIFN